MVLKIILFSLLGLFVLLVAIIFIRALAFKPKKAKPIAQPVIEFDKQKTINDLAELIRCKTISNRDPAKEDNAEFDKLENLLPKLFPNVFKTCEYNKLGKRTLLFRWIGKNADKNQAAVFMAHYDVVPVEPSEWSKPAFEGIMEKEVLWGRGTLDTKGTFNGVLQAAEHLIGHGFVPDHDIYLAFAGNEEIVGGGAKLSVQYFIDHQIKPLIVVDEGGAVVTGVFPGVKQECALIGTGEKGYSDMEFTLVSNGGHASSPKPHTVVGMLSQAAVNVENHPFKMRISRPAAEMLDTLGRHSTFVFRLIFANLWLFRPVLDSLTKKAGGEFNAMVRTTVAFTQMEGSKQGNVLPSKARMVANLRFNSGDTAAQSISYLRKVIDNDNIKVNPIVAFEASKTSTSRDYAFGQLSDAIRATWGDVIVSPYLMVAGSDSRFWNEISDHVYRFSAMRLSKQERGMIHGNDERIPFSTIVTTVEFYIRIMQDF